MRRLVLTLAATLAVAGPLASSGMAAAKDHHGGGYGNGNGGWQQQRGGGDRGGGDRGGGRWNHDEGRPPPQGRWIERGDPRAYPQDAPPPRAYPRGGYAPREPDDRIIQDHARYRLRPPPRGFAWVRMGNGFALIQESTGQVFDTIPGR